MERVNAKFHSDGNERRDSDVIWRIPLNGDAYLLLMLEFQSTPDHWMALRVMVYAGLLWQHLVKEKLLRGIADYRRSSLWSYTMAIRAG